MKRLHRAACTIPAAVGGPVQPGVLDVGPAPPPTAVELFDPGDLVERLMGDEELARRIVGGFLADIPHQMAALAGAISRSDPAAARLHAHSIKGAAANVGGHGMRKVAGRLEQLGSAGDLATAAVVLPELQASFERARPAMEQFRAEDEGGNG